ncbi:MAG: hypothetical protein IJP77_06065 [Bacteroidales bacterium]|nr:hypothetical protein [Bacteroidales bacterium]
METPVAFSAFSRELSGLLSPLSEDASRIRGIKGSNDRVDALTLLVRGVLSSSSLCHIDGELHVFGGRCYVPVSKQAVLGVLANVLTEAGFSPTDIRKMADMPLSVVSGRSYPRSRSLLCFTNIVASLDGVKPVGFPFGPQMVVTEALSYAYDPDATCPLWEAFLSEVLPDSSVRAVLQEFFGMCYLDRRRLSVEKFLLLIGSGANGKSVIFEVMKAVFGEDNVSTFDSQQLVDEKMVPYVKGRRLNFAPDMRQSSAFDSALKALSSGQDVTGRRIYGEAEKVQCPPLCFAMNEMPFFKDTTDAFFRRLIPISFEVTIPPQRQDRSLVRRIVASDLPGIFNWAIAGRNRLLASGGEFSPCPAIDGYLRDLRRRVEEMSAPVRRYLSSKGYAVYPSYDGQPTVKVSQREIASAIGDISPTAITREMGRYGIAPHRSREIYYRVYQL